MAIAEVAADHRGEPVGLAVEGERGALDLLVVLELDLEQPHHLDREAGGAGDADAGELVGGEDLLDVALGDDVAHRGAPVAGHHDAAGERRGDDRGAVRRRSTGAARRQRRGAPGSRSGAWPARKSVNEDDAGRQERRGQPAAEVGPCELTGRPSGRSRGTNSSALVSSTSSISSRIASTSSSSCFLALGDVVAVARVLGRCVLVRRLRLVLCGWLSAPGPPCLGRLSLRPCRPRRTARVEHRDPRTCVRTAGQRGDQLPRRSSQRSSSVADVRLGAAQRLEGRDPLQRRRGRAGRRSPSPRTRRRPASAYCAQAPAAEVGPGVLRRRRAPRARPRRRSSSRSIRPRADQPVVEALLGADVGVLQVDQLQLGVVPVQPVAVAVPLEQRELGHPVELAAHSIGSRSSRSSTDSQRASTSTVCASASEP